MTIQFEISKHLYKCLQKRIELGVASELDMLVDKGRVIEQEPCEDCISRQAYDKGFDDGLEEGLKVGACGDCISRADVIELISDIQDTVFGQVVIKGVEKLPPVAPKEPKTGHWEWVQYDSNPNIGNWHCSECRTIIPHMPEETDNTPIYKWCPMCGRKMESEVQDADSD